MKEMLLSVIMAVYNTEKYLPIMLDSLINQSFDEEEYEILCVDDCSTDSCREIIRNYAQKHKCVKLIENDVNHGASYSRNRGFLAAKGKYVYVVDSDDFVRPWSLRYIVDGMMEKGLKLCFFPMANVDFNAMPKLDVRTPMAAIVPLTHYTGGSPCERIVENEVLRRHNILNAEGIVGGEDSLWVFQINSYVSLSEMGQMSTTVYHYRRHDAQSTSNMRKSYPKIAHNMLKLALIYKDIYPRYEKEGAEKWVLKTIQSRKNECVTQMLFWVTFCDSCKGIDEWWERLRSNELLPISLQWRCFKTKRLGKTYVTKIAAFFTFSKLNCKIMNRLAGGRFKP